jgi:hypothetical protein
MNCDPWQTKVDDKDKGGALMGIGLVAVAIGLVDLITGPHGPPTGRWSFLFSSVYRCVGPTGLAIFWVCLGIGLIVADCLMWKCK